MISAINGASAAALMTRLIFVDGDKGGVGKTFMARALAGYLLARGLKVHCFDGDIRNGVLERHYKRACRVDRIDLRSEQGFSHLYDALEQIPADTFVLCDLPAGAGAMLHREAERLRLNEEFGRELIHIWVADTGEDSVRLFKDLRFVADPTRTAFVMNMRGQTDLSRFTIWHGSNARNEFISEGGLEVRLPNMPARVHDQVARAHAPFLVEPAPQGLRRSDLLSLRVFNGQVAADLGPLFNLILKGAA